MATRDPLDIQDYLDATSDASRRTRTMTIILVTASILIFAGWLNSLQSHWMQGRMLRLQDMQSTYTKSYLGDYPQREAFGADDKAYERAKIRYEQHYNELYSAMERAYVDNALVVRVPFLGFTFDVNDLGLLGGIGFLVVLVCYRFFLSREIDNLRLSFGEAERLERLDEFYKLLAMRQVFTVPRHTQINRTRFLHLAPKIVCAFPVLVYLLVFWNDIKTRILAQNINADRYSYLIGFEVVAIILMIVLTSGIVGRLRRMDNVWDEYGKKTNRIDQQPLDGRKNEPEPKANSAVQ